MGLMEQIATAPGPAGRATFRLVRSQRSLQVILGLLWLLDGALQFQPFMFGRGFVNTYVLPNADGQPAVLGWVITNVGHFIAPHIALWNTLFALIQVGIGAGLLFRRTVRPALAVSYLWVLGVWVIGEGLGMVLTGTASPLTGAPGAALLYGAIGLMAWPRHEGPRRTEAAADAAGGSASGLKGDHGGVASSAAGRGIGGSVTPLVVWSGFWILAAILFLLPDNRTGSSVSSAIVGMSPGEPSGYAHFLSSFGNQFTGVGTQSTWVLAVASLAIGLGPLLVRRVSWFLLAGGLLAGLWWVSGQGLGSVFTGSGTDPNSGPLVILLALAMVPATRPVRARWHPPLVMWFRRNPILICGAGAAVGVALLLGALYPAPAGESASTAMSGMHMQGAVGHAVAAGTSSCRPHQSGTPMSGLDLTNTPYMIMGGSSITGMDMNGADASAAAGLNTTTTNWHYTGPAIPNALAQELVEEGNNGPGDIHMAATGCAPSVTASQQIKATQYVQATSQAAARYPTAAAASAAGYVAASPTTYPLVTYLNPAVVAANAAARRTLDPQFIDGLVYATIPSGQSVLAAAMYVLPSSVSTPPMPYGALVQWHQRTALCGPSTGSTSSFEVTGAVPCAAGSVKKATPYVTMVWQVPVAGGPLAIQPPDIQTMEAAVMAAPAS